MENETPNIMYGRLKEAANISGYSLERAMNEFNWLLDENRWQKVGEGFDDINEFLKTISLSEFKIAAEQRKEIAQKLNELRASQRAAAKTLGVTHTQIQRDIGTNVPIKGKNGIDNQNNITNDGTNVPPDPEPKWVSKDSQKIVKDQLKNIHVSNNSGENEWYTPPEIIELAREVLGNIDLDPASSEIANKIIKADNFYTIEIDGLSKKWYGNIWLNPPYSQPQIKYFSDAVLNKTNEYEQICILVNNATETEWLQNMMRISDMICFITGRVKFIDKEGIPSGAPLQGQVVIYKGKNTDVFYEKFKDIGICMRRILIEEK